MGEAWQRVLEEVYEAQERMRRKTSALWYRGQRRAGWAIQSSLHRHVNCFFQDTGVRGNAESRLELLREEGKSLSGNSNLRRGPCCVRVRDPTGG
jgi:hypothetical protein